MLLGKVLASAAMEENKYVTWLPAYGPEVRGGTAHCMVVISDKPIGSPYIDKADTLIIMNAMSYKKFYLRIKRGGLLLLNSSLIDTKVARRDIKILKLPLTDIAVKLGNIRIANMVGLGAYVAKKKIVGIKSILNTITDMAKGGREDLVDINKKALLTGQGLIND